MTRDQLGRVRWGVRAVLTLGIAASVFANVLHAEDNLISQGIAAWPPLALLLTVELIGRVPVTQRWLTVVRLVATTAIAGIAAEVSYFHMAAVVSRYGERQPNPYLLPLSVDGLIVVASICLVELGGRIRTAENINEGGTDGDQLVQGWREGERGVALVRGGSGGAGGEGDPQPAEESRPAVHREGDAAAGAAPAEQGVATEPVKLTVPRPAPRKPHASNKDRVVRAHNRNPDATNPELARTLNLSLKTVERYRPAREIKKVNGTPVLAGAKEE